MEHSPNPNKQISNPKQSCTEYFTKKCIDR